MRFKLRTKLIFLSVFVVVLTMANVTYFFTFRQIRDKRTDFETQMQRIAENIATMHVIEQRSWTNYQSLISQFMAVNDDIVYIAIYDDRNDLRAFKLNRELVAIDASNQVSPMDEAMIVARLDKGLVDVDSRSDISSHEVNILSGDRVLGSVHVGFSLIEINDLLRARILRNVLVAVFFIFLASAVAYFLSRRISGPLERLSKAMAAVAKGHLEQRVIVENRDEIGQLAVTFNEMAEGLHARRIVDELSNELNKSFHLPQLSELVCRRFSEVIDAATATLYLHKKEKTGLFHNAIGDKTISLPAVTLSYIAGYRQGFVFGDIPEAHGRSFRALAVRAQDLFMPMFVKDQLLGFLVFTAGDDPGIFGTKTRELAAALAGRAALALENALLYDELKEREWFKRELEIAWEVQNKLLPKIMPECDGFLFDAICLPATEVGGDYYDFFRLADNKLAMVVADVSGKGTSAAFYMAEIKGMMSTLVDIYHAPATLLGELNKRLYSSLEKRLFATMIYGVLDTDAKAFSFVRAGHNSLLFVSSDGNEIMATPPGIGLGLDPGDVFDGTLTESTITLYPGDRLILFTDGITEAMNDAKEEFGEQRLLELVKNNLALPAPSLREEIVAQIRKFVGNAAQHDDLTMIIVEARQSS